MASWHDFGPQVGAPSGPKTGLKEVLKCLESDMRKLWNFDTPIRDFTVLEPQVGPRKCLMIGVNSVRMLC